MGSTEMNISLRRGEKIFINGAVVRVDRKVCLELLNDATFLIENHVMLPQQANSPLKKLYLAIQTILMSPSDKETSLNLCYGMIETLLLLNDDDSLADYLHQIRGQLTSQRPFDALKTLRPLVQLESKRLNPAPTQIHSDASKEGDNA